MTSRLNETLLLCSPEEQATIQQLVNKVGHSEVLRIIRLHTNSKGASNINDNGTTYTNSSSRSKKTPNQNSGGKSKVEPSFLPKEQDDPNSSMVDVSFYPNEDVYSTLDVRDPLYGHLYSLKYLKRRYLDMSKMHHPDKNQAADAKQMQQKLANAWEILETGHLRDAYDRNRLRAICDSSTFEEEEAYINSRTTERFDEEEAPVLQEMLQSERAKLQEAREGKYEEEDLKMEIKDLQAKLKRVVVSNKMRVEEAQYHIARILAQIKLGGKFIDAPPLCRDKNGPVVDIDRYVGPVWCWKLKKNHRGQYDGPCINGLTCEGFCDRHQAQKPSQCECLADEPCEHMTDPLWWKDREI